MNNEMFWSIIEDSRVTCQSNIEQMTEDLEERLENYSDQDIQRFFEIFELYHTAAKKDGIASIANLMNHEMLTDDGFIDFRNWLIAQGKDVYMQTLKNPEVLANENIKPIRGWYEFETLGYVGLRVAEKSGNKEFRKSKAISETEQQSILDELIYGEFADKSMSPQKLKETFPKLAKRFIKENDEFGLEKQLSKVQF